MRHRERACAVYGLAGDRIVTSDSLTRDGVWIFNGHAERIFEGGTSTEIGEAVRRALDASVTGVAHPTDWAAYGREAKASLGRVGVSSFARLHRSACLVRVSQVAGIVTVTPHESGGWIGPDRGFRELPDLAVTVDAASGDKLGETVLVALERARRA